MDIGNFMQKNTQNKIRKPPTIRLLSVLCIICGFILILVLGTEYSIPTISLNFFNAITTSIIAIVSIILGYGIWMGDWKSLILIYILIIILIPIQLIRIEKGNLSGIYGLIVCCLVIYSLMRSDIRRLFRLKPIELHKS
jgi:hypothetical protein